MGLNKIRLGDIMVPFSQSCGMPHLDPLQVSGVNRDKEFFEPSRQVGEDTSQYQIVPQRHFACNLMHVGRDKVLPIAFNHSDKNKVVSPAYTVFSIKKDSGILDDYFFLMLKCEERDRYFWFHTDASIRDGMTWEDFCNVDIYVPSIPIQQKYIDVYNAALKNQQCYERGVNDLKMVCDGYIENLRRKLPSKKIGEFIQEKNSRNSDLHSVNVQGVNSSSSFGETKADTNGLDFTNYKIVKNKQFAYNPSRINLGSIALFEGDECIVSPMYCVFSVDEDFIIPEYLMLWFTRKEFQRSTFFYAMGSVRDTFDFGLMKDVSIPVPSKEIQQAIVDIYMSYMQRQRINDILKNKIKSLCPVLIKGSILEAQ